MMREMRSDRDDIKDTVSMVYHAAVKGSVVDLNSMIQNDPLILSEISLNTFEKTPLHISSALGHLGFTKELLTLKPKLASRLDNRRRSPLHCAAAEGHLEIARALLHENKDVCLVRDKDGRIPLHYAAMRGPDDLIQLLISAQHESIFMVLPSGETTLHLCVQHNHLEALKQLVDSARDNSEFLNAKEPQSGKTILHLAIMLNQVETVDYLRSIPGVEKDAMDHLPRDFNRPKNHCLMGIIKNRHLLSLISRIDKHLEEYEGEWLKEMRGSIMVVATVIATMTFQAAINPPGGVWQQTSNSTVIANYNDEFECSSNNPCIAGTSVAAHAWSGRYLQFIKFNSTAFLASLCVILVIVGGFPVKNKVCVWLLTVAMGVTLTFMALTFIHGMSLVTPSPIWNGIDRISYTMVSFCVWAGFLGLIGLYHNIMFLSWLVKNLRSFRARMKSNSRNSRTTNTQHLHLDQISTTDNSPTK